MKVGILTFHRTNNYGAIYQCYALQKYINSIGVECEVIDYNNKYLTNLYDINPFKAKGLKEFIKKSIFFVNEYKNNKYFLNFTKNHIKLSEKKYHEDNIKEADNEFDFFIAGSDQIWNLELSGNDKNYFMVFTENIKKRNSYAASIGAGKIKESEKDIYIRLINLQNNISIRETAGKKAIEELTEKKIYQCIDPVFLLDKKEWISLKNKKNISEKYILVYEVARTEKLRSFAEWLSNKKGYKILFVSKSGKKMKNAKSINDVSPEEFLNYIYYAEYVVTSSFHGMAMSLIFNKEFYYDLPEKNHSFGSRLESLGKIANVENRIIVEDFAKIETKKINYELVMKNLNSEIKESKNYIKEILNQKWS